MNILSIDYGRKKIGLAIAEGPLAEPYKILRYNDIKRLIEEIGKVITDLGIEKVIVGISEGKMAEETRAFSLSLSQSLSDRGIQVEMWDETLSTQNAQQLSREAGIKRKKRKELEDAYSAALILQGYLDNP